MLTEGGKRVKVTFEIELLTADQETLNFKCEDMESIIWDILDMQSFPVVDAVDDIDFRIEDVKE